MQEEEPYKKIAKNTVVLGSAQLVQMMVTLIRAKAIAILFGPFGAGINSLVLSALSVMQQVSSVGIYQSGVREMSIITVQPGSEYKLAKFRKLFLRLSLVCGTVGVLTMALLSPVFSFLLFDTYTYTGWLVLVSLSLFFMALQNGYGVIMQATCNLALMAKATSIGAILGLTAALLLFYFIGLHGIVPAIVVSYGMFYVSFRYFERKIAFVEVGKCTKTEFPEQSIPVLKLGIMLMVSTTLGTIFTFAINLVISRLGSVDEVGIYQSATSIAMQGMSIANVILASDFFARLSAVNTDPVQIRNLIKQQVDILLYTIAPVSVLIIVFAPFIVWILLSPRFALVAGLLQIMSLALVFKVIWMILSYIMLAKGDKKGYFLFDALLGNGTNFIVSVIGFYFFGLSGLAFAYLAGAVFMVALLWFVTKKRYGTTLATADLWKMMGLAGYLLVTYFFTVYTQGIVYYVGTGISAGWIIGYSVFELNRKIRFKGLIRKSKLKK